MLLGHISQASSHLQYSGRRRYFRLFVHPDLDHFRRAAHRYSGADFSQASGCCHPAPVRERYDVATDTWYDSGDPHWAGIVRLVSGHIHSEVVAHEMTHAALVVYRMDIKADVRLSNGCGAREELLAYIVGDLTSQAADELHRLGVW
jgi:head-tail adaptor